MELGLELAAFGAGRRQAHWTSVVFSQGSLCECDWIDACPRFRHSRADAGPGDQMGVPRKAGHVDADLGEDCSALRSLTPGIVLICSMAIQQGAMPSPHFPVDFDDSVIEGVDLLQMKTSRNRWCRVTRPRRAAKCLVRLSPGVGQTGQFGRIRLAGDHRLDHLSPAQAHDIGDHQSNLMLASSSVFCIRKMWLAFSRFNCLRVRRACASPGLGHWHEAGPDQTVRQ